MNVDTLPPTAADPFYLFQGSLDWQGGATYVAIAAKRDAQQSGAAFRMAVRQGLVDARPQFVKAGIDQVIAAVRDQFLVVWMHSGQASAKLDLGFLAAVAAEPVVLDNQRIVCQDEPPQLKIAASSAYNFIFLREARYFLR